jgi:hypothetical protein
MKILSNGYFSFELSADDLAKGLRPKSSNPRNNHYLTKSSGAVGKDGVLQTLATLTKIDPEAYEFTFPYPQVFVFTNHIIVCDATRIFELVSSSLELKLTVTTGSTWSAVDFFDYIYLSNETVSVIRSTYGTYELTTDLPKTSAICNFNGQVIIGSPGG